LLDINHWITEDEQKRRFLADNPADLLLNNHRNHHGFISQVISMRDAKALIEALPWVYNAYHGQGVPLDYFKEELQQWIIAIEKNMQCDSNGKLRDMYSWMLETHDARCKDIIEGRKEHYLDPEHPFLKAIVRGDHRSAFKYAQEKVKNWKEFEVFFTEVARPALYEIGLLWEGGHVSVAAEHLATAVVNRVLSGLLFGIDLPETTKRKVLVTCIASEYHQIGPWMVATALEANGWEVDYLGADTPPDTILKIIASEDYAALLVSVTMPYNLGNARKLISMARDKCPGVKVILGGQAFGFMSDPSANFHADLVAGSYEQAVEKLNEWF